ncbi:MAG: hypothetical protein R3B70_03495 [Polyangiaceae bacterium]
MDTTEDKARKEKTAAPAKNGGAPPPADKPSASAAPEAEAEPAAEQPTSADADKPADKGPRAAISAQAEELYSMLRRFEAFAADEAKRVSGKLLPQVESKAKQNIWMSLLLALGLGLILGLWLNGGRRRG